MRPIEWHQDRVRLIDQRLLPLQESWVECRDYQQVAEAIRSMRIRGAPAIGIAAGYGMALAALHSQAQSREALLEDLARASGVLAATRPTAVNLFWALRRVEQVAARAQDPREAAVREAVEIAREDEEMCRRIGHNGAELVPEGARLLTHCNAGALATGDYGTALGVVRAARDKLLHVWVDETRPFLQGARLTAWELVKEGIPCRLICDNMAGHFMQRGEVDLVVVGADRITASGDVANKIGTYSLAVLCRHHGIPLYVAAPSSTIDLSLTSGRDIPIEERSEDEVTSFGANRIAPLEVAASNPAFDVTPRELVSALVTERGVLRPPFAESITRALAAPA